ncbi:ribosome small subunit-dependent GTPase A, partial [Vibrio parahaemolyticus]
MNQTHTFCYTIISTSNPLKRLGWKPYIQQQLTQDDYDNTILARVIAHHRSGYLLSTEGGQFHINVHHSLPNMTVGDWVILNEDQLFVRLLD